MAQAVTKGRQSHEKLIWIIYLRDKIDVNLIFKESR